MTVLEDISIGEALVFETLTLKGDNDLVGEGDGVVVCNLDLTSAELESRGMCFGSVLTTIPNSFLSFRTTVEELISPEKLSHSSSSRVSKKVSGSSVIDEIFSWAW